MDARKNAKTSDGVRQQLGKIDLAVLEFYSSPRGPLRRANEFNVSRAITKSEN